MPINTLSRSSGATVIEHYQADELGQCSCGRPVRKIIGSDFTNRTDGVRYAKPDDTLGWGMFRCDQCHAVISQSYMPSAATS